MRGVIVAVAGEVEAVGGQLVPLLAGHLAGLAADAQRRIGEEAHHRSAASASGDRRTRRGGKECQQRFDQRVVAGHCKCPSGCAAARRVGGGVAASARAPSGRSARRAAGAAGRPSPGRRRPCPRACSRWGRRPARSGRWRCRRPLRRRNPSGTAGRSDGRRGHAIRSGLSRRVTIARASMTAARRTHRQPAAVLDAALGGQLRAEFDEHFRLQFVEPAIEPAHRAAQVVLGQPERAGDDRVLRRRRRGPAG